MPRFPYATAARSIDCDRARQSFVNLARHEVIGDAEALLRKIVSSSRNV
jgi:hypothetical protein